MNDQNQIYKEGMVFIMWKKLSIFILFSISLLKLFAFTNTYADWYGIVLFEPSFGAQYFASLASNDIDIFRRLTGFYMFESNANPRQPSILTSGFTFYKTLMSLFPSEFKYDVSGIDYNLSAKLLGIRLGNSPSEFIFGFGGAVGLNLESVELEVGSSDSYSDFTSVDFRHLNKVYLLNFLGTLRAYIEIPLGSYNFPSLLYMFNYNAGITLFGPFLPNLKSVSVQEDFRQTFSVITHSLAIRFKF